ncbi:MAG TPA: nicotinate phosphoribosyltransferase, partial [Bacteroidales bacterium]
ERVKEIKNYVNGRIHDVYGIGTFLSNDVGVQALNMVIKIFAAKPYGYDNFVPTVKLSDVEGKHTGDEEEIALCLKVIRQ